MARLVTGILLVISLAARAGTISFDLSHGHQHLVITNKGDSTAYYPDAFALGADGQWQRLAGSPPVSQIAPSRQARWQAAGERAGGAAIALLRPTMVCFFDQAGVSFGQVAFFTQPDMSGRKGLEARYSAAGLELKPPSAAEGITATWVLAAPSDGIAEILGPGRTSHRVPLARRIDWSVERGMSPIETGASHPPVVLIHETGQGPVRQDVASDIGPRSAQRAAWLNWSGPLFVTAQLAAGAAMALLMYGAVMRWRRGRR